MTKVILYALLDPESLKIRYIGITITSFQRRLYKHLDESRYTKRHSHKIRWIRSLANRGLLPVIRKLKLIDSWEEALKIEREVILKYKVKKSLTNCENFLGDGRFGKPVPKELKKQISNTLKEYFKTHRNAACKCINVYTHSGEFLGMYDSITDCVKELDIHATHICGVLKGKNRQYKGYLFKYCDDESEIIPLKDYDPHSRLKKKIMIEDTWSKETFNFDSQEEASKFMGVTNSILSYKKKEGNTKLFRYRYKINFI